MAEVARRQGNSKDAERHFSDVRTLVENTASSIERDELRSSFRGMAEQLVADPLTAYR
jgi:hypothetical protein